MMNGLQIRRSVGLYTDQILRFNENIQQHSKVPQELKEKFASWAIKTEELNDTTLKTYPE